MTCIVDTKRLFRLSAKVLTGASLAFAILALGAYADRVSAQGRGNDSRHEHYRGNRDYHHGRTGGYYRPPPIVYGSPYGPSYYGAPRYYPPPVVYGPPFGFSIQIR